MMRHALAPHEKGTIGWVSAGVVRPGSQPQKPRTHTRQVIDALYSELSPLSYFRRRVQFDTVLTGSAIYDDESLV